MNVLITGGAGSGGSYLAEYIIENHPEYKVWIPVRWHSTSVLNNIKNIKDKVNTRECDLNDLPSIIRLLEECKPKKIFHMAATANVHVAFKTPLAVLQNNIFGVANLLEAIRLSCPDAIFQMCSTSEIFGTPEITPISELHPINPSNAYAVSKLCGDRLSYAYWKSWGLKILISRAFCYANPKRHDLFATSFALQIARIEQGKQLKLRHGNLSSIRTIMSVKDMSEAYWIISNFDTFGEAYNLGGTEPFSVGEFLNKLIERSTCKIVTELDESLLRPSDITNQCPDCSKFFNRTYWRPKYSIDDCADFLLKEARETTRNS